MITVQTQADDLIKSLEAVVTNLPKELRIVSWKTARKTKSFIAKQIATELATTQKVIKKQLKQSRKGPTGAEVDLEGSPRIPLKNFKARQTKKGVSYKISKTKGRKKIPNAFIVPGKMGNHVMKRVGKKRFPLVKLRGASPWAVFAKNKMQVQVTPKVNGELGRQLAERLRFKKLKHSGAI